MESAEGALLLKSAEAAVKQSKIRFVGRKRLTGDAF